jgi:tripartite-type tricarboxylate transporter receptor subunit TctC
MRTINQFVAYFFIIISLSSLHGIAQTYPQQVVRVIVPAAPGGGVDIIARLLAYHLGDQLNQKFIVENRTPSGLAGEVVAKASPNGHTLMVSTATYLVNRSLYPNLGYDPLRDISTISLIGSTPIIIVCHPSLPVQSVSQLVEFAKRKPGALNYGSGGNGSPLHLAGELFKQEAKVNIVHVAYRGTAPAAMELLSGQMQVMFPSVISMYPYIQSGRTRVLAVLGQQRSKALPNTPTSAEVGLPGLIASIWYGLLTTAGTPKSVVMLLHQNVVKALANKDLNERLQRDSVEQIGSTPEEFASFAANENTKWSSVIKAGNITAQ